MRVLVTGGAGFIGSHVVDRLRAASIEPRIFDLRASSHHGRDEVEAVVGDLLDPAGLTAAMDGCEAVVHLAAAADADAVAEFPAHAEQVNSRGTLNVLEAAREAGVTRIVYASTIWVYSDAAGSMVDEDTPLGLPGHLYTATKLAGEMYCRSYGALYGLEYTILRFGIPYGPRSRPAAVVPSFVRKALAGEPLTIAGGGRQSRCFVYVEDLAEGVVRALAPRAANRVYNLVGNEDVTIREVAETVCQAAGNTDLVDVPGRSADFNGVQVSGERAARDLDWRASTPFAAGVRRYVAWHRALTGEAAVPQSTDESARGRSPHRGGRLLQRLAQPTGTAAFLLGVAVVVGALFEVLRARGAAGDDLRTIAITSLLGLTLYASLAPDAERRSASAFSSLAWLTAGLLVALVFVWPHDVLRLADADVNLIVLSIVGCAFGAGAGAAARWLRGGVRERAPDITG
jgi:UDP-glucose 4-epimerase